MNQTAIGLNTKSPHNSGSSTPWHFYHYSLVRLATGSLAQAIFCHHLQSHTSSCRHFGRSIAGAAVCSCSVSRSCR